MPHLRRRHPMPRFFFTSSTNSKIVRDEEGADYPNQCAALHSARLGLREMLSIAILDGRFDPDAYVTVEDREGNILETVRV
ncbi:DUF6894 family protein [Novosphingobium sp. JCM 18896]|uniref:DUF6894 family protein n=1 Tax=Novosphingobium sp. JCM 18896 TaxID=2989731 RepID=UPI0039B6ABDB